MIAPGPIAGTEGVERLTPEGTTYASAMPVGRLGDVRDVANATVFLFSDAASFITGQILPVEGGSEHLRSTLLPYPQAVLDPASVKHIVKPRL